MKFLKRNPLPTNAVQLFNRLDVSGTRVDIPNGGTAMSAVERANLINQTAQIDSGSTFAVVGTSPWEAVSTDDGDDDDAFGLFSRMTSF